MRPCIAPSCHRAFVVVTRSGLLDLTRSIASGLMKTAHGRSDRTRHSALQARHAASVTQHPALGTRHRTPHPAPSTRHFNRPPPPEVGRRQAAAFAGAARLLSGVVRPVLRAVCGQRGRVLRSLCQRTAGRRASDADGLQRRSDWLLSRGAGPHCGCAACPGAPGPRARDRRRRSFLRGPRSIQPYACPPRRARRRRELHAVAGRDADLFEPHWVQRTVPAERRGTLQRASGPVRAAPDLRPGAPGGRRRGAGNPGRQPGAGTVRVRAGRGPRRRSECTSIRRTRR